MKKVKFSKKLELNKETIANLNSVYMLKIKGGENDTSGCVTAAYTCCVQGGCTSATVIERTGALSGCPVCK